MKTRECNANDQILVKEGYQCSNCGALNGHKMKTRKIDCTCDNASDKNKRHHTDGCARSQVYSLPHHTPTPWEVTEGTQPHTIAIVNDQEQFAIAVLHHDKQEDQANAAFIVRAVNAHEDMLSLLKMCWSKLHGSEQHKYDTVFMNDLAEAIAKAENGE